MKLKDKFALIIGAGSGLARAIALAFAREGAKVDVSDSQQVKQMFAQALEEYSTIDILVNNAGLLQAVEISAMEDEQWWLGNLSRIRADHGVLDFLDRFSRHGCPFCDQKETPDYIPGVSITIDSLIRPTITTARTSA